MIEENIPKESGIKIPVPERPERNIKKDKAITVRFSEKEKQLIDITAEEYETSITKLVRKAVFCYLDILNGNKKIIENQILNKELTKIKLLKRSLDTIGNKITEFRNRVSALGIPKEIFEDFVKKWIEENKEV